MAFFQGKPSWAFDAERISGYEAANANFMDEMLKPWQVSIPMLQQLVHMDLAYFHARHLKWEVKEPVHLKTETARFSDDDEPPAARSTATGREIRFC